MHARSRRRNAADQSNDMRSETAPRCQCSTSGLEVTSAERSKPYIGRIHRLTPLSPAGLRRCGTRENIHVALRPMIQLWQ